jgi:hypothetical protein
MMIPVCERPSNDLLRDQHRKSNKFVPPYPMLQEHLWEPLLWHLDKIQSNLQLESVIILSWFRGCDPVWERDRAKQWCVLLTDC